MHTSTSSEPLPEPTIIPRSEHPISRKDIDREALKVMYRLRDAGHIAYLVGGGVRDLLLGNRPKDFDISTDARPGQLRKIFRNSRIIGRRFRLVQVFFKGGKVIEVSTFRTRSEYDDKTEDTAVLPSNNTFGTPAEDAFRRDLTINALFYEIENFTVIDYTGGMEDLRNGVIRLIGNPRLRITHDPVRTMRVIRHAARNDFSIETETWAATKELCHLLDLCPVSRLRDELFKDLKGTTVERWLRLAVDSGVFHRLFPCYRDMLPADGQSMRLLLRLGAIIDRFHRQQPESLPEPMLLALILLPYAIKRLDLLTERKGAEFFAYSRQVRAALDDLLVRLNIKRMDKEVITGLLVNVITFEKHSHRGSWPKKLQRKSYFEQGLQFFQLYREGAGGQKAEVIPLPAKKARRKKQQSTTPQEAKKPAKTGRKYRPGGRTPAFARKTKGGVFGLKRR